MYKKMLVWIALLALTLHAAAQADENGFWKFRDATVYGADQYEREDEHGTVVEKRAYEKGQFTVVRQYNAEGKDFTAAVSGLIDGLNRKIEPGEEMAVSLRLTSKNAEGPRENAVWGRVTAYYGRLNWTPATWEDEYHYRPDREYKGQFMSDDNVSVVYANTGESASAVLKNNALAMKEAGSDIMNIIVSCGGMDVVYRFQWLSKEEAWVRVEDTSPKVGTFSVSTLSMEEGVTLYKLNRQGNIYHLSYEVKKTFKDSRSRLPTSGMTQFQGTKEFNRKGETGYAEFQIDTPDKILYPGSVVYPTAQYLSGSSSWLSDQNLTDNRLLSVFYTNLAFESLGKWDATTGTGYSKEPLPRAEDGGIVIPQKGDMDTFQMELFIQPALRFYYTYQWGSPADLDDGNNGSVTEGGGEDEEGGENSGGHSGRGIPWVPIGIGVIGVGGGGTLIGREIVKRVGKAKRKSPKRGAPMLKQKPGESNYEWLKRQAKSDQKNLGIKHPVEPVRGETHGEWFKRQEEAERMGKVADEKKRQYENREAIEYGTYTPEDTRRAIGKANERHVTEQKKAHQEAYRADVAYKVVEGAGTTAKYTAKGVEYYGKATGNKAVEYTAKGYQVVMGGIEEHQKAAILEGVSEKEALTRTGIKMVGDGINQFVSKDARQKAVVSGVQDALMERVKKGSTSTGTLVKSVGKNYMKNRVSDAIPSMGDSESAAKNLVKGVVEKEKSDLLDKLF